VCVCDNDDDDFVIQNILCFVSETRYWNINAIANDSGIRRQWVTT